MAVDLSPADRLAGPPPSHPLAGAGGVGRLLPYDFQQPPPHARVSAFGHGDVTVRPDSDIVGSNNIYRVIVAGVATGASRTAADSASRRKFVNGLASARAVQLTRGVPAPRGTCRSAGTFGLPGGDVSGLRPSPTHVRAQGVSEIGSSGRLASQPHCRTAGYKTRAKVFAGALRRWISSIPEL